jgi:hypothetical protein
MRLFMEKNLQGDLLYQKIVVFGALLTAGLVYFSDILNCWFFYDDPAAMVFSMETVKDIFLVHNYSYAFYTPLVAFSFKPDVLLFGMNPLPYHIHNVIVLVLVAFAVYSILRLYTDRITAFAAALVALLSAPSLVCIVWITLRQYLYSMLFALAAIYLFLKYKPNLKGNTLLVFAIAVLAELSFMGKEQYMVLPFVLFILSQGTLRQKISATFPYFLVLGMHFLLRWSVLGSAGGYLGMHYDPMAYIKTTYESFLTASRILFGTPWVLIPIAIPFLLGIKRVSLLLLLWLTSLSISFLAMSFYPSADTYRYWFIPVVLFSFLIGFGAGLVKKFWARALLLGVVLLLFLNNSLQINRELKGFFREQTLIAQRISDAMIDSGYRDSLILLPDNRYIRESSYVLYMSRAYARISNAEIFATFYPIELVAYYPEITGDFGAVYELRGNDLTGLTDSAGALISNFRASVSQEKPEIKLFTNPQEIGIGLKCRSGRAINVYSIRRIGHQYYGMKDTIPYMEYINLKPFMRDAVVQVLPIQDLMYKEKTWYVKGEIIPENTLLLAGSCVDTGGQNTRLSDIISIPNPKR